VYILQQGGAAVNHAFFLTRSMGESFLYIKKVMAQTISSLAKVNGTLKRSSASNSVLQEGSIA